MIISDFTFFQWIPQKKNSSINSEFWN